ncbi:MAG: transmembrane(s)proteins 9..31 [Parcubacteria bacterium 33_209]|nr:MAG: transmembrane(s)proteins 9..31 [Parcubacteria bacterium 33_209]
MNKIKNKISFLLVTVLLIPVIASADAITSTISNITTWIVTVSTGLAILMYTVGGFLWMSDAGNAEKAKMAKSIIVSTTIGLIIILLAAGLTSIIRSFV